MFSRCFDVLKTKVLHIIVPLWLSILAASCGKPVETVHAPSPSLSAIDSLMWQQPDSALAVMMEFAASPEADSLDELNGHYCQLLISELLFKNNYAQSNRTELMAAMDYFDSLVDGRDAPRASALDAIAVFLDARAHYMNGAGYYERDSLVPACTEYLRVLRIMENRFAENELVGRKASFMSLTYNRLMDLFSFRLMQEPAIYCGKQSLHYDEIEPPTVTNRGGVLYFIGKQYQKLNENDSAAYYYEMALEALPDGNNPYYRDIVAAWALLDFDMGHGAQNALDSLKSILTHAVDENERMSRYIAIGAIYKLEGLYDSAKYYLEPVFENDPRRAAAAAPYLHDLALNEGDSAKANRYAQFLVKEAADSGDKQARVSQLNDMFRSYLREKQEIIELRERVKTKRITLVVLLTLALVLAVVTIVIRNRHSKFMAAQEEAAQKRLRETALELKNQVNEAVQQAQTMLPHRVNDIYHSKISNRTERIMAEFEAAYPGALGRLAETHPGLTETERQIAVLNFLQFRAKEEADLLGLRENTVMKYRSNLRKKTANASFPEIFS